MDGELLWDVILKELSGKGLELQTKRGYWFRASSQDKSIQINNAVEHSPSCKLSIPRTVIMKDFLNVYPYYHRWSSGAYGIGTEITGKSQKSVYILSLIKRFL